MKTKQYIFIFSFTTIIVVFFILWKNHQLRFMENGTIKIGAILPLTGDISEYGKRTKMGIDLAIDEINGNGSPFKNRYNIVYEDDKGVPKDGVNSVQKLIDINKINYIIGSVSSTVTLAILPIIDQRKVILFSPAASSPKLTGMSSYFFRDWPSDLLEATVLSDFAFKTLKFKKISILYVNNDYGIGLRNEFIRHFKELGGSILNDESYAQSATDFRSQLDKIKNSKPEAIYLSGYHREMAIATKQIKEVGIPCQILGNADYGVQELLEMTGTASEGAIFSIPEYLPNDTTSSIKHFTMEFRKKYGKEPSIFEANGYDALMVIAQAIDAVGNDTKRVSDFISSLKHFKGASGDISFDQKREVVKPITIKTVENGAFINFLNKSK